MQLIDERVAELEGAVRVLRVEVDWLKEEAGILNDIKGEMVVTNARLVAIESGVDGIKRFLDMKFG